LQGVPVLLEGRKLFLPQRPLVGVGARRHPLGLGEIGTDLLVVAVPPHNAREGRALLHPLGQAGAAPQRLWVGEVCLEPVVPPLDFVQLVDHLPGRLYLAPPSAATLLPPLPPPP